MPNLSGLSRSQAQTQLNELGLTFTVYVVPSDEPVGKVVAQEPKSGTAIALGSAVRYNTLRAADDALLEQRVVRGFTRVNRIGPERPSGTAQREDRYSTRGWRRWPRARRRPQSGRARTLG
jgi:beta-lactam-binding protein with PASTA domain